MTVRLDKRLQTVADMVRLDKRIADIGTDHALLPCYLSQLGAKSIIATDISDGPLKSAKASIELYGAKGITLIKCNGLDAVPPVDDVIIAGMGGETIADMISRCLFLHRELHFILQPMTRDFILRRRLYAVGCEILREKTAVVSGKVYTVMLCGFSGQKQEIGESFAFLGKNGDTAYLEKQLAALAKMGRGDKHYREIEEKLRADSKERY